MRAASLFAVSLVLSLLSYELDGATVRPHEFLPGQMWSLKPPASKTIRIIIGRVEKWNSKTAVHISLIDIPIVTTDINRGRMTKIAHMPFEESALSASVDQLITSGVSTVPGFEDGYAQWKSANGGIYKIGVDEALGLALATVTASHK